MPAQGYQRNRGRGTGARRGGGRLRIVAGRLGGRRIPVPEARGLRPTPERTRETLFNWLRDRVRGAQVLDLFAGSGVLAFEALSRGAAGALLLEHDARVTAGLRRTCSELGLDATARVLRTDAFDWLERDRDAPEFDLVFVDPPFGDDLAARALRTLAAPGRLAADARVYLEWPAREPDPWDPRLWTAEKATRAGDSRAVLLMRSGPGEAAGDDAGSESGSETGPRDSPGQFR